MAKVDFEKLKKRYGPRERIEFCPAWDGEVTLRRASSEERMEAALLLSSVELDENRKPVDSRSMIRCGIPLVSQTIVEGDVRPFDSDEGREELLEYHMMAVVELLPAVLEINLLGKAASEAVDEAKKNLIPAASGE